MARTIPVQVIGDTSVLSFDGAAYSLTSVQKAALKYSAHATFQVGVVDSSITLRVDLFEDAGITLPQLLQLLQNEALDQVLREKVFAETAVERQLILSYAFSRSKLTTE